MKKSVAIIGGGAGGIMVGCMLDSELYDIHIFEQKKTLGRKLMVAGKGGFNLTHGSEIEDMIQQYHPKHFLRPILQKFTNQDLRKYLNSIGIPTFVGSSGRVFPKKGIKPAQVLKALIKKLKDNNVRIHYNTGWTGFGVDKRLRLSSDHDSYEASFDIVVFSLGGKSWTKTGSDGMWISHFDNLNVRTVEFAPSNCGIKIDWPNQFLHKWEGHPIKNIVVKFGDVHVSGEALVTRYGLEGGAIYALSSMINREVKYKGHALLSIDLKPSISAKKWRSFKIKMSEKVSVTESLKKKLNLERIKIALLKAFTSKEEFINEERLSQKIKDFVLTVEGVSDIDEAISTTGGIALDEIDENLQLRKLNNHYVIGEMVDWDAPTGGYLLQACFSMGAWVAYQLNNKGRLESNRPFI